MSAVADGVGRAVCARREPCGVWAVRACGARARERESRAAERRGRGQPREGTGQRDSIADGTALRNIVGEEVAATLRTSEIRLGGSFFV